LGESAVESTEGVGGVGVVVLLENLLDGFSNLGLVVEGDGREEMVSNMVVRDVVKEETTGPAQKWPVNSGGSATEEGPLLVAVVSDGWVGVVEIGKHDDPVVGEQVRNEVKFDEVAETNLLGPQIKDGRHNGQTDVGSDDSVSFMGFEERRRRFEMVSTRRIHRVAHDVGEEVVLPAKCLHEEHATKSVNWRLFKDIMVVGDVGTGLRRKAVVRTSAGNEVLIALNGHGGFVVSMVSRPPGVVRDKDKSMHGIPDDMVHPAVIRQTSVSGFVGHAPPASKDNALNVPVEGP